MAAVRPLSGALLGCLLACSSNGAEPAPVEVGVAVPFASGDLMLDARQGWELVLDSINEAGGVRGRPLAVVERDTALHEDLRRWRALVRNLAHYREALAGSARRQPFRSLHSGADEDMVGETCPVGQDASSA